MFDWLNVLVLLIRRRIISYGIIIHIGGKRSANFLCQGSKILKCNYEYCVLVLSSFEFIIRVCISCIKGCFVYVSCINYKSCMYRVFRVYYYFQNV